jgi:hypothetical protein
LFIFVEEKYFDAIIGVGEYVKLPR